ncbi:MAG: hypothetical protein U0350_10970 [Caldilineaceae bacterium]
MQVIFERLRELDSAPNQILIDAFNRRFATKNPKYRLISNEQVRPCFFTGDIESPGRIVSVSLQPAYTLGATEDRQAGKSFQDWYDYCRFRFTLYESEQQVHSVFKNLFKVIAPPDIWATASKREYLQAHLVNLDWCCYYSESFPTFKLSSLPSGLQRLICTDWDERLRWLIEIAAPQYIFAHGKALEEWANRSSSGLVRAMRLESSLNQPCYLFEGMLAGTSTPIYYLEHFINQVNENETLQRVGRYANRKRRDI